MALRRQNHARAGHDVNIRSDREDAMLLHGGEGRQATPQGDHFALVALGHVHGVGHVAHVEDDFRVARDHFFERNVGIGGQRVAKNIFSAGDADHLVQKRRFPGDHQRVEPSLAIARRRTSRARV